jgi:hypothetical protein
LVVLKSALPQSYCKIQAPFSALPYEQFNSNSLSPSSVLLYILIDACGDYFCTSRMCSASRTSGMYTRVWGGDPRHGSGGPVPVVRFFFRPARSQK